MAVCPLDLKSKNTVSVLIRLRLTDEKCLIPSLQMLPGQLGKFIFTSQYLAPDPVCSLSCLLRGHVALTDCYKNTMWWGECFMFFLYFENTFPGVISSNFSCQLSD